MTYALDARFQLGELSPLRYAFELGRLRTDNPKVKAQVARRLEALEGNELTNVNGTEAVT